MSSPILARIEALLFFESHPLSFSHLATVCDTTIETVQEAALQLQRIYQDRGAGVEIIIDEKQIHLATAASQSDFMREYSESDMQSQLSRPSLETLTIVAYRGPVAKSEIELIRGVNCSVILRNLSIRGLVTQTTITEAGSPVFAVTTDFLRHLGVSHVKELPEYDRLHDSVHLQELLKTQHSDDFFEQ